ncbi:aspartyl-phosphate phosphatase Spo0E family protein [Marinicrinis lubricantis]|uniref:Aspartyl-phosphate phosphatase Spo0E family protein n=1 Tax=Marinicrinis lubricantis TaxID=2086470 RepID=A0ABW1ITL3_9BACL
MEKKQLMETIERLRSEMVELAEIKGSMLDDHVIAISQKLDRFLTYYQMRMQLGGKNTVGTISFSKAV